MHFTFSPMGTTRKAAHVRSASQPCYCHGHHSHPVLARLDGAVRALRAWPPPATPESCGSGLALVDAVLTALRELLELPQTAAALGHLHGSAAAAGVRLLDGFLALADAYGTFEPAVLALKRSAAEQRAGVRRGDGAVVAASLRDRRRTEKELCHLAAAMRHAVAAPPRQADSEVTDMVAKAAAATAAASEAIFSACAAMSPDVPASMVHTVPSNKWLARLGVVPVEKKAVPETAMVAALERLEECIDALESGSEKVFRSLVQTRVSLLNIHNPL